ncbi:DUF763 domain-containing protein [Planctomycetes bacterium Pan216]
MTRRGTAHLPLHGGKAPRWLFERMVQLAGAISIAIVRDYGPDEMLRRLSDPFWFQAFGCVLGFDWHSSGVTTTVCGALKEATKEYGSEMGFVVCGGKGKTSRRTPEEIDRVCQTSGDNGASLIHASRTAAKVDSAALQDGYQVYQHSFFFIPGAGEQWCVVQQGMNDAEGYARRYHWLSGVRPSLVSDPHAAVADDHRGVFLNLVAEEASQHQACLTDLSREHPDRLLEEASPLFAEPMPLFELAMPRRHTLSTGHIDPRALRKVLVSTYEKQATDFETLLGTPGLGPKALRSLSLIAEVIHNQPASRRDPAAYSFAHGGKDGHPYHVNRLLYDENIDRLRTALNQAQVGHSDKLHSYKRLAKFVDGLG